MQRLLRLATVLIFLLAVGSNVAQQSGVTFDPADWANILNEDDAGQPDRWEFLAEEKESSRPANISLLAEKISITEPTIPVVFSASVVAVGQRTQATTVLQL